MATVQTEVTTAIQAGNRQFERNIRARDATALVEAFYAEDALVLPPDQPIVSGRAQVTEFWQQMFRMGLRGAALATLQVEASDDLVVEVGKYTLTLGPEGPGAVQSRGKYLVAYRRQADGGWKATADMFSGDGPAG